MRLSTNDMIVIEKRRRNKQLMFSQMIQSENKEVKQENWSKLGEQELFRLHHSDFPFIELCFPAGWDCNVEPPFWLC